MLLLSQVRKLKTNIIKDSDTQEGIAKGHDFKSILMRKKRKSIEFYLGKPSSYTEQRVILVNVYLNYSTRIEKSTIVCKARA